MLVVGSTWCRDGSKSSELRTSDSGPRLASAVSLCPSGDPVGATLRAQRDEHLDGRLVGRPSARLSSKLDADPDGYRKVGVAGTGVPCIAPLRAVVTVKF